MQALLSSQLDSALLFTDVRLITTTDTWHLAEAGTVNLGLVHGTGTGTNISEKTPARQWVGAVYFAVMLLTTTGLGDTEPATPAEEILASIQMMMGLFVFGLIISVSQ